MRGPLWLAQLLRVWKGSGISRLSDGWAAVGLLDERGSVAARCTWELPPAPAVSRVLALSGPSPVIRPQLIGFRHVFNKISKALGNQKHHFQKHYIALRKTSKVFLLQQI